MAPLDGARLKVVRAQQHLDSLKQEIGRYLETRPYEFPTECKGDAVVARPAVIKVSPPLELGCIVGDCLGNLRKSLDYIAWQLGMRYSTTPLKVGKNRITFPVIDDAPEFTKKCETCLTKKLAAVVPASAHALIESIQPYHTGYEPLRLLNRLVNSDKHCLPLLTVAYAQTTMIQVVAVGGPIGQCDIDIPAIGVFTGFDTGGMIVQQLPDDGTGAVDPFAVLRAAQNASAPALPEQQPGSVKVDGQVTVFVSLDDPPMPLEPIDLALEQIVKCVANIVPMFDALV
jgi:hypothetical protein